MVLEKVNLEFEFYNNVILIRAKEDVSAAQQKRLIKCSVKDDKGLPLSGGNSVGERDGNGSCY